ncbi:DNA-binding protein [Actinacidiphila alni]|uniref:DNA-binding protein n=1 Tax=Actinacidiphila alni TaxID=380248 RepID=UPI0033EDCC7A
MKERSYPAVMRGWAHPPVPVADEDWVSQPEAAKLCGVSLLRMVFRILNGHLTPAHNSARRAGVSRASIERDLAWLAAASRRARVWRACKGIAGFIV